MLDGPDDGDNDGSLLGVALGDNDGTALGPELGVDDGTEVNLVALEMFADAIGPGQQRHDVGRAL